ncbi:bestrophin-like domain [Sphaerotilaceae bacterium SBD11-9]
MYEINGGPITAVLFLAMLVAVELGFRLGLRRKDQANEASRSQISTVQGSILGILALLLAFTLSQALQRYDSRSDAVVDEANAIGTAYLRAQLLPAPLRGEVQALLRDYVDIRVGSSAFNARQHAESDAMAHKALQTQNALWEQARQATEADPKPATSGLYVQALNEVIDSYGRREAGLDRHVPELAIFLLFLTLLVASLGVGYSSGVNGERPPAISFAMLVLVAALVFVILDLDRPRRGVIVVSKQSLFDLQSGMRAAPQPAPR